MDVGLGADAAAAVADPSDGGTVELVSEVLDGASVAGTTAAGCRGAGEAWTAPAVRAVWLCTAGAGTGAAVVAGAVGAFVAVVAGTVTAVVGTGSALAPDVASWLAVACTGCPAPARTTAPTLADKRAMPAVRMTVLRSLLWVDVALITEMYRPHRRTDADICTSHSVSIREAPASAFVAMGWLAKLGV